MRRRRRLRVKSHRQAVAQAPERQEPDLDRLAIPAREAADAAGERPVDLDRLLPATALAGASGGAAVLNPPELIVEPPERIAERRARDARDGVKVPDPGRRRILYVGIALFVALLVFAVLAFMESPEVLR